MNQRSPVSTPLPTPTSSPKQSMSEHMSLPSTPELSQAADHVQLPPDQPVLPTADAAAALAPESLSDDADDFPSYDGQCLFLCFFDFA